MQFQEVVGFDCRFPGPLSSPRRLRAFKQETTARAQTQGVVARARFLFRSGCFNSFPLMILQFAREKWNMQLSRAHSPLSDTPWAKA